MKFDPQKHHRHSIRLPGYDYTQSGGYYVTIVTHQRGHFFGEVVNGVMCLNELGQIAQDEWFKTAVLRSYVKLFEDEFVVMPNHVHVIIWIENGRGGDAPSAPTSTATGTNVPPKSLGAIVRAYKSAVTYAVNALGRGVAVPQRGGALWQRNYYEHVIRNEKDLQAKRDYIMRNPSHWENDNENIKQ